MNPTDLDPILSDKVLGTERRLAALTFERSPAFQAVQFEAVTQAFAPYLEISQRFNERIKDIAMPAQQLAAIIANPVIEEMTLSLRQLSEKVSRAAIADLKLPQLRLPDLVTGFQASQLAGRVLGDLAESQTLGFAQAKDMAGHWDTLHARLPDLKYDVDDGGHEPNDVALRVADSTSLLTFEDRVLLLRAFWVFFVLAQLVSPDSRRLLDEYSVVWEVITLAVFSYHPKQEDAHDRLSTHPVHRDRRTDID